MVAVIPVYATCWNCITRLAALILLMNVSHCDVWCWWSGCSWTCCRWCWCCSAAIIIMLSSLLLLQELLIRQRSCNRSWEKWWRPEAVWRFWGEGGGDDAVLEIIIYFLFDLQLLLACCVCCAAKARGRNKNVSDVVCMESNSRICVLCLLFSLSTTTSIIPYIALFLCLFVLPWLL